MAGGCGFIGMIFTSAEDEKEKEGQRAERPRAASVVSSPFSRMPLLGSSCPHTNELVVVAVLLLLLLPKIS